MNVKKCYFGSDAASSAHVPPIMNNLLCKMTCNYMDQFNVVEQKEQYYSVCVCVCVYL